ncbi:MAG: hypothetical protein NVS1B11_08980 [Terriglobales bacterium]
MKHIFPTLREFTMKLIKADHDRRLEIAGVPGLVRRPVDIDQSKTGFTNLRTLRIYRFDPESVIDGHAEEDEVFIIVLSGLIELTMTLGFEKGSPVILSSVGDSDSSACVAYLPPQAAYRLVPHGHADIAYVRATPVGSLPPRVFRPSGWHGSSAVTILLNETSYAEKLRVRLARIDAAQGEVAFAPLRESEANCEALLHVQNAMVGAITAVPTSDSAPIALESWDTVSIAPGEFPTLRIVAGAAFVVILFSA